MNFEGTARGVKLQGDGGVLEITALTERAVRVRFSVGGVEAGASLVLVEGVATPEFEVREVLDGLELVLGKMRVDVARDTLRLSFFDGAGDEVLREKVGGRMLRAGSLRGEVTFEVEQAFESPGDERIFGTGQFQDGFLNIRDLPRRLTQVNTQIAIPFVVSSKGFGLLWHNYGLAEFNPADERVELRNAGAAGEAVVVDVTTTAGTRQETRQRMRFAGTLRAERAGRHALMLDVGRKMASVHWVEVDGARVVHVENYWLPPTTSWFMELSAGEHEVVVIGEAQDAPVILFREARDEMVWRSPVAEAIDYVVIAGNADEVIGEYRKLTGPAPLLPKWALGYIHCRERYKTQGELLENAMEHRRRGLPLDVIVQDWQYWGRHGWNAMQFDAADYPDAAGMVRELHANNMRLMLSVWSKVDPQSELGREIAAREFYIAGTEWVDFFNPAAAQFYWEQMREKLVSLGIDAWWMDATEPENDDLVGRETHAGAGERVRNVYPLHVVRAVHDGLRAEKNEKRVCILTRSAFAGAQRYGVAVWSGDIGNDWETLRRQVHAGLNMSTSGLPWWTTDCGGFFRPEGQYDDAAYHERLIRWLEFAACCPLMRVHGYQSDTELWRYGTEVERVARGVLALRYRLLPYLYSAAADVALRGGTLMRPLMMDFGGDAVALDAECEYMFGQALLVAPVVEEGAREREVYLPKWRGGWVNFWAGERAEGGQRVMTQAELGEIPLWVKGGSVLVLEPEQQHVEENKDAVLEVRVYAGADGECVLYEDAGDGFGYERGEFTEIVLNWDEGAGRLRIGERRGVFAGMVAEREFEIVLVRAGVGVGIAQESEPSARVQYVGKPLEIVLSRAER